METTRAYQYLKDQLECISKQFAVLPSFTSLLETHTDENIFALMAALTQRFRNYFQPCQQQSSYSGLRCYYQNVQGMRLNLPLIQQLIVNNEYDIFAFAETWHLSLDRDFYQFCRYNRFQILHLPAELSIGGHNKGGLILLVRNTIKMTGVVKERFHFGEHITCVVDNIFRLQLIYRRPEGQTAADFDAAMQFFTTTLDTQIPTLYIGDFNWQMYRPQHSHNGPVSVRECTKPFGTTDWSNKQSKMVTQRLQDLNLVVFSGFAPTHARNRCIDYLYGTNDCKRLFNIDCKHANALASDHVALTFKLSRRITMQQIAQTPGMSPSRQVTTFKIGRATNSPLVVHNALDILHRLQPYIQSFENQPCIALGILSMCVFASFKAAQSLCAKSAPPFTPSYTLLFRNFRAIVSKIQCLKSRRSVLKAQRFKYNIKDGYLLKRNLVNSSFAHRGFYNVISKGRECSVVEAPQADVRAHFEQFFNRQVAPEPLTDDFLQDLGNFDSAELEWLNREFTIDELQHTVAGMSQNASVGAFGIDVKAISLLLESNIFGPMVQVFLWKLLQSKVDQPLLVTILTAIPKVEQSTSDPALLRPISVTSVWYRVLTRLFTQRLNQFVPRLFSSEQHGFCPKRSTVTAMGSITPVIEHCKATKSPVYLAAVDINKAYDSVSRDSLVQILKHLGLESNVFIQLILGAMQDGPTAVTGARELSEWFWTSRGIKQGCPASPTLFGIILSGLQRRLERIAPGSCITIGGQSKVVCSYADDLKLMAKSEATLQLLFAEVQKYLGFLGLEVTDKCKVLVIGEDKQQVTLGGMVVETVSSLRFLGIKITNTGGFLPWRDEFTTGLYGLKGRLTQAGLGTLPTALCRAIMIKIVPALLYGSEIWSVKWIARVFKQVQSPYKHPRFEVVMNFLRKYLGLPSNSFGAMIFKLFNFPSILQLLLPKCCKFLATLSPAQWEVIEHVAASQRTGFCSDMVFLKSELAGFTTQLGKGTPKVLCAEKLATHLELRFWESQPTGSRHAQFYTIFHNGACVWPFMNGFGSRQTLLAAARLFALQHRYFWGRGTKLCHLCNIAPATFSHLMCECSGTQQLRDLHDLPSRECFLRVALLSKTSKKLFALVSDVEPLMAAYCEGDAGEVVTEETVSPTVGRADRKWVITWDGSFDGQKAGLGITLALEDTVILRASVPVYASDATRCEALGPALAALLLDRLQWSEVTLRGDSLTVVQLLRMESLPKDVWLYNATQLTLDLLQGGQVQVVWIPREQNPECDALARQAVAGSGITLAVHPDYEVIHCRQWKRICIEFVHRFDMSHLYPQRSSCVVKPWSF